MYAIRGKIIKVCAPMSKLALPIAEDAANGAANPETAPRTTNLVLSGTEIQALHRVLESLRHKIADSIDKAKELQLSNLLEDLDCEEATVRALVVSKFYSQ